jgi:hypothetical protein
VSAGPKAVVLEIEEPRRIVERLLSPGWNDWLHSLKGHRVYHCREATSSFNGALTIEKM